MGLMRGENLSQEDQKKADDAELAKMESEENKKLEDNKEVDSKLKCPTCYSLMKERKKDYICTNKDCKRVEKKQEPKKENDSEKKEVAKDIDKKLGKCPVCLSGMRVITVKVPNSEATKAYLECTDTACRKRLEK